MTVRPSVADEKDGRIPAAARFSLDVLARQHAAIAAEIGAIEKRIHAWHRSSEESRRLALRRHVLANC
jgi:transposase